MEDDDAVPAAIYTLAMLGVTAWNYNRARRQRDLKDAEQALAALPMLPGCDEESEPGANTAFRELTYWQVQSVKFDVLERIYQECGASLHQSASAHRAYVEWDGLRVCTGTHVLKVLYQEGAIEPDGIARCAAGRVCSVNVRLTRKGIETMREQGNTPIQNNFYGDNSPVQMVNDNGVVHGDMNVIQSAYGRTFAEDLEALTQEVNSYGDIDTQELLRDLNAELEASTTPKRARIRNMLRGIAAATPTLNEGSEIVARMIEAFSQP